MKTVKTGTHQIPGASIQMGGRDWVVPPLTLGQLRRLMPKVSLLTTVGAGMGPEQIEVLVEIVAAAMSRNYPQITTDELEEVLDLGNASLVLTAVLTGSGLKQGEAIAVASPNGEKSMASSPPPAVTVTPLSMT